MSDDEEQSRQEAREARRRARMDRADEDDDERRGSTMGGDDEDDEATRRREEAAQERQRKQEERERREQKEREEESRNQKKKSGKKKGLGGLTPEKKKMLKQLIMTKAAEEMKAEAKKRQEEKENTLKQRVGTIQIEGLDENGAKKLCKDLHDKIKKLEGEKYDWEVKIRNQEFDINELTIKVNDVKGKFVKPVLKKVNKTESKLARITKLGEKDSHTSLRGQLKSTGQNKFALEEKEDGHSKQADWRDNLKGSKEGEAGEGEQPAEVTA